MVQLGEAQVVRRQQTAEHDEHLVVLGQLRAGGVLRLLPQVVEVRVEGLDLPAVDAARLVDDVEERLVRGLVVPVVGRDPGRCSAEKSGTTTPTLIVSAVTPRKVAAFSPPEVSVSGAPELAVVSPVDSVSPAVHAPASRATNATAPTHTRILDADARM